VKATAAASCWALLLAAGCASGPVWQTDVDRALRQTRKEQQELVVFFALPGRQTSDRMQQSLGDPAIAEALVDGGFATAIADGVHHKNLYAAWIGFGEGMGLAVLDANGQCYAARPGPMDPPEHAAWLRLVASSRERLAAARSAVAASPTPLAQHEIGCLFLQLGRTKLAEEHLLAAATAGVADARHRLARLHALDGNLTLARRWLAQAPPTGAAQVTEGYLLYKERRHRDAVLRLEQALQQPDLGEERQRALLYLGKALHEDKQDARARPLLAALAQEGTGSTFEAAALHTLAHIDDPQHGHQH
jgi:tetratricopeptide (TPR) repeat protein